MVISQHIFQTMFRQFSLNIRGKLRVFDRPLVMGIVNVTPDSFYGRSRNYCDAEIISKVEQMVEAGVDILDVGGYSSRPGADDVCTDRELRRVEMGLGVIKKMAPDVMVSVDTFRSEVASACVRGLGADIINDISGGTLDEMMPATVAELGVPYVLMHMRGNPTTMQQHTEYDDVTADVIGELSERVRVLRLAGVSDIILDPGFGFSKTMEQNYELMRNLGAFCEAFDEPLLVGVSRKSMITKPLGITSDEALNGTTVLNTLALASGASILRVHDVKEAVEAVKLFTLTDN